MTPTMQADFPRRNWLLSGAAALANAGRLAAASALGLAAPALAQIQDAMLPSSDSLQTSLSNALQRGSPLLVMVSLHGCPFCKVARNNYLAPIQGRDGLLIVQLDMRSQRQIIDFKGQTWTQDALIRHWKIKIAPTVLFFGKAGVELAERLEGAYIPDFYGAYLEERITQARKAAR